MFAADAARKDLLDPIGMLFRGKPVSPDNLAQLFTDTLDRRLLAASRQGLRALERIDRGRLGAERRISYDVFRRDKLEQIAWLQPDVRELVAVRPLTHFGGLHVDFPTLMSSDGAVPYASEADYRSALALDSAFAQVLDNALLRFRQGKAAGVVESKLTVANMIGQLDALIAQPVEQSPFYSPVLKFPATVPGERQEQLRGAFAATIGTRIVPAYQRLRDFLVREYLPAAREAPGLGGDEGRCRAFTAA